MLPLKRFSSSFLLSFGTLFLIVGVHSFFDSSVSRKERVSDGLDALLLGTYMTAWGGASAYKLRRRDRQQELDRRRSIFFQTLQQNSGSINVLQFAMAANLPGAEAKQFLDEQSRAFAADCEVDDRGGLSYRFDMETPSLSEAQVLIQVDDTPSLLEAQPAIEAHVERSSFDVVLEFTPYRQMESLLQTVQLIAELETEAAKHLILQSPSFVRRDVSRAVAEACQRQLEAVGAIVTIRDHR